MTFEVVYSRHARRRMVLRGISTDEVETALRRGAKYRQGPRLVAAHRYFEVVFVVRGSRLIVITVKPRW
jgi:hypothetical protein